MTGSTTRTPWRKRAAAALLAATGLGAGALVIQTQIADAATGPTPTASASATPTTATGGTATNGGAIDQSSSVRADEHLLTGTTATRVRAAALAKFRGATIQRVETDSDGVYEAHIVTAAGQRPIVSVGSDFTVTGTSEGPGGGARRPDVPPTGSTQS